MKIKGMNKARPMPNFDKKTTNVRLNNAALKREKHLIEAEESELRAQIEQMTVGLKDASEFNRWRTKMGEKDEVERLEHIHKKKLEMELARELAIKARVKQERENRALGKDVRQQREQLMEELQTNLQEVIMQKKEVVTSVK